jgi:hypothetical protein
MSSLNPEKMPATDARQGIENHGMQYVLSISLGVSALALIALFLIFTF